MAGGKLLEVQLESMHNIVIFIKKIKGGV